MQATAVAHPNIALIKYWGKSDVERNIPAVGSLSITLDGLTTTTSVLFDSDLEEDEFFLGGRAAPGMAGRVTGCLDLLRGRVGIQTRASVESYNDFPTAAGLASSASGFAALVTAADAALDAAIPRVELADIARRASGSAARSLFGGVVELRLTPDGLRPTETQQLLGPSGWPLRVAVAVTETSPKEIGSTEGMVRTERTSPYYASWVDSSEKDLAEARGAVERLDFEALADVSESSSLKMHAVMLSARPGLVYWNGATVACIRRVRELRSWPRSRACSRCWRAGSVKALGWCEADGPRRGFGSRQVGSLWRVRRSLWSACRCGGDRPTGGRHAASLRR
jgi:diphosphomevalonate decarboxylase